MTGLRVDLEIDAPETCTLAKTLEGADTQARNVRWSHDTDEAVEQFTARMSPEETPENVTQVFSYDGEGVFQFDRAVDDPCPCQQIENHGFPISDAQVNEEMLQVTLHLGDSDELSELLQELKSDFENVSIRTIAHEGSDTVSPDEFVPIDRGKLTDRQQEVMQTAYEMGYFEYPRQANATDVADQLDICPSTLAEHMAAAQAKIVADLFEMPTASEK